MATGKSELANQIKDVDEIIDDFNFISSGNSYLDNQIKILNKLSQAKDSKKRYVVVLTDKIIESFSIINHSHIAWLFINTLNPKVTEYYSEFIPITELEKNNSSFMKMRGSNQRPYLLCYSAKNKLVTKHGVFSKNTVEDMKIISKKKRDEWR